MEKIKEILKDKNKLTIITIVLIILSIIFLGYGNKYKTSSNIAKALLRTDEYMPKVILFRILLIITIGLLSISVYNLLHLIFDKNNKTKKEKKLDNTNKLSFIKEKLQDKIFIIIAIAILLIPTIYFYKVGNHNIKLIENQKEIVRLTEDIGSYNNYLGYQYREKAKDEKKELTRRYIKAYGGYATSIVSGILIIYLSYKLVILIKREKDEKEKNK